MYGQPTCSRAAAITRARPPAAASMSASAAWGRCTVGRCCGGFGPDGWWGAGLRCGFGAGLSLGCGLGFGFGLGCGGGGAGSVTAALAAARGLVVPAGRPAWAL